MGGVTIQMGGSLLLFMDRGTVTIWHDGLPKEVIPEIPARTNIKVQRRDRVPSRTSILGHNVDSGTEGRLYRVDPDGSCIFLLEEVGCSNGMAFHADCRSFYHTDSFEYEIHVFDYDREIGDIQNQELCSIC